jgi:uncharacterized membrane protein YdbT with pleckstrin-like domain
MQDEQQLTPHPEPYDSNDQPVAYDAQGRPLYSRPQTAVTTQPAAPVPQSQGPQVVYVTRAPEPAAPVITPDIQRRHQESRERYPSLNLSSSEFVVSVVKRHPIGLIGIWLGFGLGIILSLFLAIAITSPDISSSIGISTNITQLQEMLVLVAVLLFLIGAISASVYSGNQFFLTNESIIQRIQTSLFSRHEQTVSLGNIEDASYQQSGLAQMIFDYGSIRLSTEGEETTYRFSLVSNPKHQVDVLNNAVEAFKNGRPVNMQEINPD